MDARSAFLSDQPYAGSLAAKAMLVLGVKIRVRREPLTGLGDRPRAVQSLSGYREPSNRTALPLVRLISIAVRASCTHPQERIERVP